MGKHIITRNEFNRLDAPRRNMGAFRREEKRMNKYARRERIWEELQAGRTRLRDSIRMGVR